MILHNVFTPASPVYLQNTYINEEFCTLFVKCFQCAKNLFQCCCDHYVTTISKLKQIKTDWHESIFCPYTWLLVSSLLLPILLNKKRYLHNASKSSHLSFYHWVCRSWKMLAYNNLANPGLSQKNPSSKPFQLRNF